LARPGLGWAVAELEALNLNGPYWWTPEALIDGATLFEAVGEWELEGVVAKRVDGRYRPCECGWIKVKNRNYWRYELERELQSTSDVNRYSSDARKRSPSGRQSGDRLRRPPGARTLHVL
jgi:hypothetical protein